MRKLKLYIASSLDGYIARENGDIDWLFQDGDYGYTAFYESVDTVVMGNKTYQQSLSFGGNPYPEKKIFVFTRNHTKKKDDYAEFTSANVVEFIASMKSESGGDIWLVGGAEIIKPLVEENLIDDYIISVHPVILGSGIPLFEKTTRSQTLQLINVASYETGLAQLSYERKS